MNRTDFLLAAAVEHSPLLPAWPDIIWSLVVFVVLLLFFWRYVLPKMNKLLDDRSQLIEGRIAEAQKQEEAARSSLAKYDEKLKQAHGEAAEIRDAARRDGEKIVEQAQSTAEADAKRTRERNQVQLEADRQAAAVALRQDLGELALQLAERVLDEKLSDDKNSKQLVEKFIGDLDSSRGR